MLYAKDVDGSGQASTELNNCPIKNILLAKP
jgi:hypothetical protein